VILAVLAAFDLCERLGEPLPLCFGETLQRLLLGFDTEAGAALLGVRNADVADAGRIMGSLKRTLKV
jgi:hypothetical protein